MLNEGYADMTCNIAEFATAVGKEAKRLNSEKMNKVRNRFPRLQVDIEYEVEIEEPRYLRKRKLGEGDETSAENVVENDTNGMEGSSVSGSVTNLFSTDVPGDSSDVSKVNFSETTFRTLWPDVDMNHARRTAPKHPASNKYTMKETACLTLSHLRYWLITRSLMVMMKRCWRAQTLYVPVTC